MNEKGGDAARRPSVETRLAELRQPVLDRATTWPYEDGELASFAYQRYDHPLAAESERVLGDLEGGRALLFSCGMAAISGLVLAFCKPGDAVAVPLGAYVSTSHLISDELSRFGLRLVEFDQTGPPPEEAAFVWLEPCSNPMLSFPDLDDSINRAHERGALVRPVDRIVQVGEAEHRIGAGLEPDERRLLGRWTGLVELDEAQAEAR